MTIIEVEIDLESAIRQARTQIAFYNSDQTFDAVEKKNWQKRLEELIGKRAKE